MRRADRWSLWRSFSNSRSAAIRHHEVRPPNTIITYSLSRFQRLPYYYFLPFAPHREFLYSVQSDFWRLLQWISFFLVEKMRRLLILPKLAAFCFPLWMAHIWLRSIDFKLVNWKHAIYWLLNGSLYPILLLNTGGCTLETFFFILTNDFLPPDLFSFSLILNVCTL